MQALHRKYELYIGQLPELTKLIEERKVVGDSESDKTDGKQEKPQTDIRTIPELKGFVQIKELQIEGNVEFDREGSGSKNPVQKFKIYNPNEETLQYLKFGNLLMLKAGYNEDVSLPIICATEIVSSKIIKREQDRIVELVCSEAYSVRRAIRYNKTFPAGDLYIYVMNDILDTFSFYGVPLGYFDATQMNNIKLNSEKRFSTTLYDALEQVCDATKYKWYIAQGQIWVYPDFRDTSVGVGSGGYGIVKITEDVVKGSIQPMSSSAKKDLKDTETNKKGVKLTVNLNGDITSADGIEITYGEYKGKYLISKVSHKLNYEGTAWDTIIECKG